MPKPYATTKLLCILFLLLTSTGRYVEASQSQNRSQSKPNIIIVMTDDQGYGEMSCHGNPILKTPHIDNLHDQSIRFYDFHAAPMCTPTRGQLLTGLDAARNGAINVSSGRTLMKPGIPTIANILAKAGYKTGLFGKWHLGDNYPFRPQDRGFEEIITFPSSHINSVPDKWNNDYFDDTYLHNGTRQAYKGYCTDVFFREAMAWMKKQSDSNNPFFLYLPTNAPHSPHWAPESDRNAIEKAINGNKLPNLSIDLKKQLIPYLAMIRNIDTNMGKLETFLIDNGLTDNTILIFTSDNGSTFGHVYFPAGMRGKKTQLWEGGHRVPFFLRWPSGKLGKPRDISGLSQMQDLLPTLLELCDIDTDNTFDGISLASALRGDSSVPEDRMLIINYSRMPFFEDYPIADAPSLMKRNGAGVLWKRWRLLENRILNNLDDDPLQQKNVINEFPEVADKMRAHLDLWWNQVKADVNEPQRVIIGDDAANPTMLTCCEWLDVFVDLQQQIRQGLHRNSWWELDVEESGKYEFELRRWPRESGLALSEGTPGIDVTAGKLDEGVAMNISSARIRIGSNLMRNRKVNPGDKFVKFTLDLPAGPTKLYTWFYDSDNQPICGAYYVYVNRLTKSAKPVKVILDTDMSGDCDDAGALAMLNSLADLGECELLAVVTNRQDLANASAAAADAINTYYGRPNIPIGTSRQKPTAKQATSGYTPALRDEFPNDIGPDNQAPDAMDIYSRVLRSKPDKSVTICSVGAFSNLAELWQKYPELVQSKVKKLVVMGGQFPSSNRLETNVGTHVEAARIVAEQWPGEIVWAGFEAGHVLITGNKLNNVTKDSPVRRAYELRRHINRFAIQGGQPSYDQLAALYAVRGTAGGKLPLAPPGYVTLDEKGITQWQEDSSGKHAYIKLAANPKKIAAEIESLMIATPKCKQR